MGGGIRLGWFNHVDADLSVAKAIEGPRNDERFFFILTRAQLRAGDVSAMAHACF